MSNLPQTRNNMRAGLITLTLLVATTANAEQEELREIAETSANTRIVEVDNNNTTEGNNNAGKPVRHDLQEQPVKMIVGGQSEDGVLKEIIVSPEK